VKGVLDKLRAESLVAQVLRECGRQHAGVLVDVVVTWPGGEIMAQATTAQDPHQSRPLLVLDINNQAVLRRADYWCVPTEWARQQVYRIGDAPRLIGSVLRIYYPAGTASDPTVQMVGVIGLLGIAAQSASEILAQAVRDDGFLLFSDLPQAGKPG
jgi:hypothetical protein